MSSVIKSQGRQWGLSQRIFLVEGSEGAQPEAKLESEPEVPAGPSPEEIARQIVAQAEAHAQEIVRAAEAQASRFEEEGRQAGFSQGMAEAEAHWKERFAQLNERALELEKEREEFIEAAEPELAKLSVEIARKVIKQELNQSPEAVLSVVRAAIRRIKDKEVRILVNPKDLETVREAREGFETIVDGVTEIEIVSDRRVGQGGCILETPGGNLDARVETQLAHIEEIITRETSEQQAA